LTRSLTAIKTIADEFVANENNTAALTIYEMLVNEVINHFNTYEDEYVSLCMILAGCVDGLDTCYSGEEDNQEIRPRDLRTLFAIYRFYSDSGMDLDADIPGLLKGNTTPEERRAIARWTQDALTHSTGWSAGEPYQTLLAALEKENKRS